MHMNCVHIFAYLLDTWVVSTCFLAVVNDAAVNMVVLLAIQVSGFTFGHIPRGRILPGLLDHIVIQCLIFFEELPYHFHNNCTILHFHQQCIYSFT